MSVNRSLFTLAVLLSFPVVAAGEPKKSGMVPLNVISEINPSELKNEPNSAIENPTFRRFDSLPKMDMAKIAKRTVAVACLLGAACVVVIYIGNRRSQMRRGNSREMRVIDTMSLAPRCYCDLVQVRDQLLVVARDPTGIQSVNPIAMSFHEELDRHDENASRSSPSQFIRSKFERTRHE